MELDLTARQTLELTGTMRAKEKKGSLLWVLDRTKTAMGGRLLRGWIERPLLSPVQIGRRQQAVSDLYEDIITREELVMVLKEVTDLERLIGRVVYGSAGGRDLVALANGLGKLPRIQELLGGLLIRPAPVPPGGAGRPAGGAGAPPPGPGGRAPLLRPGGASSSGRATARRWTACGTSSTTGRRCSPDLETRTKEQTGIKNMKVSYNKVFGYYIEVAKSQISLVPQDWVRKQTTVQRRAVHLLRS